MSRLHIAFNAWFWDRPDVGSGQYLRNLVHWLARTAPDVALTLILPPHTPHAEDVPDGVRIQHTGRARRASRLGKVWFEQRAFPRMAAQVGADLAHIPYWGGPLSCPLPFIVTVLDVLPRMYPEYDRGFFNRLYTTLVSTSARGASHLITISYASQVDIEQVLDIPPDQITVTYLAPDMRYHPRMGAEHDKDIRRKYNLPERFVLYLGGFLRHKQVNQLLLAYTYVGEAEGENIPLVIAGRVPQPAPPVFPDLQGYARELAIEDYVRWIGYVDEADKPALYRLADVFVFPSEYEGFGLPPLEAMASGTPVVAWDAPIFDETLENGAYLVDSARAMAGAIIALLLQKPFRDTMINQGLAQASRYQWRKTAQETLAVYRRILGR